MKDGYDVRQQAGRAWLRGRLLWDSLRERLHPDARRWRTGFLKLRQRFYREYWTHAARAIGAEIDDLGGGFLRVRRGELSTFVNDYEVQLDDHLTLRIAGNKPLTYRLLNERGFAVPRSVEFSFSTLAVAERFLSELKGPAVVKPAVGTGGGRGVTTGVRSPASLRRAAYRASALSSSMLIEEEVGGASFRLLYLGGAFIDAVRRDPPGVVGDGKATVQALMAAETEARLVADPIVSLHPLTVDLECRATLRAQALGTTSVPERGRRVVVKAVVNQNAAPDNRCVREDVHPSIVEAGRQIVTLLGIELGGIDIITRDIASPLAETGGVINEVNTTPGLHHHALVSADSDPVPIGPMILEHIFSRMEERQKPARGGEVGAHAARDDTGNVRLSTWRELKNR